MSRSTLRTAVAAVLLVARTSSRRGAPDLAAEMVPVFASRNVHPEALAALALFQKAAEDEQVDLGLLEGIASSLRRGARPSGSL
jgi:hypothetical protein